MNLMHLSLCKSAFFPSTMIYIIVNVYHAASLGTLPFLQTSLDKVFLQLLVKDKVVPVNAMKTQAYNRRRGMAPLILNLSTRGR